MWRSVPCSRPKTSSVFGRGRPATRRPVAAELLLDAARGGVGGSPGADALAERPHRLGDVRQVAVDVPKMGMRGAFELPLQIRLRVVDDDQVGLQRQHPLDVRIEQSADAREPGDLWRKAVVVADAGDAVARAHREQHLGGRGHERDDPAGSHRRAGRRRLRPRETRAEDDQRDATRTSFMRGGTAAIRKPDLR